LYTGTKVTLPDTSSAAPALFVFQGRLFLAWTGTDSQHHVNVESSADGLHFDHKFTFDKASLGDFYEATTIPADGPALGSPNGQALCIAWTGTDHRLNYAYSFDPFGQAWGFAHTLQQYSDFSPALNTFNGNFTISWTDSHDAIHNVINSWTITYDGGEGVPYNWVSNNGPSVATDDSSPGVSYQGWAWTGAATQTVYVYSLEFGDYSIPVGSSPYAPSLAVDYIPNDGFNYYVAWTGTDGHLNYDVL
jgi:hypothetical protein